MSFRIIEGDCIEAMRGMDEASVDAVVCDPPYGLGFMSKAWDRVDGEQVDPAFLHWFAGFVDGEGCFSVHRKVVNGCEVFDCQFSITLRADDRPILERIHRTLGMGTLSKPDAHRTGKDNPKARYSISRKAHCLRLRDLLRAFPLRAKKAKDLELWSDALDAWVEHEPGESWDDVAEARSLLMASRAYAEEGIRVDPFQMWCWRWGREALRVLKPGGHILAFGGSRTYHRLTAGLEDAGFEIRDCLAWLYGSGFPKSLDVSKAIDKAAGAEREEYIDPRWIERYPNGPKGNIDPTSYCPPRIDGPKTTSDPTTPEAAQWQGWGTALKPAHEPIVLARKPLTSTVAGNVLAHGTGALNVDGCRVAMSDEDREVVNSRSGGQHEAEHWQGPGKAREVGERFTSAEGGRWPANVILNPEAAALLDEQSGEVGGGLRGPNCGRAGGDKFGGVYGNGLRQTGYPDGTTYGDTGGASRFFPTFGFSTMDEPCGEGSTRDASTSAGRRTESSDGSSPTDGSGSRPTDPSPAATTSTTGTTTRSTTTSPTSNSSSDDATSSTTGQSEPPKSSGTDSASAPAAGSGNRSTPMPPEPALLDRATAPTVASPTSESGESETASTTTPICGPICGPTEPAASPDLVRFFYCAKASRVERNAGLEGFEEGEPPATGRSKPAPGRSSALGAPRANVHPTVKPIALMRWLVRLITPPGGTVLDPFTGSGTTGVAAVLEGFGFVGIEREAEYVGIAEARIKWWSQFTPGTDTAAALGAAAQDRAHAEAGQTKLTEARA